MKTDNKSKRITSIDALRALTLLGILLVHTKSGFGYSYLGDSYMIDKLANGFINLFLVHKCNIIFSVLFGISFFLILRNPNNTSGKFVWRCFLLMLIGLFNKFFYTYDALMWYGFWGMCLVSIRNLRDKSIFVVFVLLTILTAILRTFDLGDTLFAEHDIKRYVIGKSFSDLLLYPYSIFDYLRVVFNAGIFVTLSYFVLGYWLARVGIIEKLDTVVTKKVVILFWIGYIFSFVLKLGIGSTHILRLINNYSASFTYSATLIYLYYHVGFMHSFLRRFEAYGKLGLTNYSMMGIWGVVMMSDFGLSLCTHNLFYALCFFLLFYVFQLFFSSVWLKYYRYGPLEYMWRVATERKLISMKR